MTLRPPFRGTQLKSLRSGRDCPIGAALVDAAAAVEGWNVLPAESSADGLLAELRRDRNAA